MRGDDLPTSVEQWEDFKKQMIHKLSSPSDVLQEWEDPRLALIILTKLRRYHHHSFKLTFSLEKTHLIILFVKGWFTMIQHVTLS